MDSLPRMAPTAHDSFGSRKSRRDSRSLKGLVGSGAAWLMLRSLGSRKPEGSQTLRRASSWSAKAPPSARSQSAESQTSSVAKTSAGVRRPQDIALKGWTDILKRTIQNIGKHRILSLSAAVTFYSLLALFPAIAALVSIYGLFANPGAISSQLNALAGVLPGGAIQVIGGQLKSLASAGGGSLSAGFIIGLLVALWSANSGVQAIFDSLNVVYEEQEKRGYVRLYLTSLAFTCGGIVFVLIALGALVAIPIAMNFIGMGQVFKWALGVARWPVLLALVGLLLAMIYRIGPSRAEPRWRWVTVGSAFASIVWLIASSLFSWYVANFGSYNKTYGALGAAVGFMTWMWISGIIVLIGAELNAQIERRSQHAMLERERRNDRASHVDQAASGA